PVRVRDAYRAAALRAGGRDCAVLPPEGGLAGGEGFRRRGRAREAGRRAPPWPARGDDPPPAAARRAPRGHGGAGAGLAVPVIGRIIETEACVAEGAAWLAAREPRFARALAQTGP